jgi:iron complex transport system substrate-binding protein
MSASALLLAVRVASINLCTDEYLLLLAQPQEIASISYLAQDPLESVLWRRAKPHHANFGSVEQVLTTRPNIILTMGGGGRATGMIAGRMNIRAVELRAPMSMEDVAVNLRSVGAALGAPHRAEPWLRRLRLLRASQPTRAQDAILLSGSGQSLSTGAPGVAWLRMAGLRQRALPGGKATLETLLIRPPAVLLQSNYRRAQVSAAANWLRHPVIRNMRSQRLSTDGRAWTCMGPLMIPEIERLRAAAR